MRYNYFKILKTLSVTFVCIFLISTIATPANSESVRSQEIKQCLKGEIVTWGDGKDRPAKRSQLKFTYNPAGAPERFSEQVITGMISKAASAWSDCGVSGIFYKWQNPKAKQSDVIIVKWSEKDSAGNFGLANLRKLTLSLGPAAFDLLNSKNPLYDARETLQLVISHEMGHFFGLMAHSRRCIDVLSYYDNGKGEKCYSRDPTQLRSVPEYRYFLPTACDIERCRMINGVEPLKEGRLPSSIK